MLMPPVVNTTQTEPVRGEGRVDRTVVEHVDSAFSLQTLYSVWEHQRGRIGERIDAIELAITALSEDRLDDELRREAERAAHMLAGSVGMFGFVEASDAARRLESALAHPTPDRAPALAALTLQLREGVGGQVSLLCT